VARYKKRRSVARTEIVDFDPLLCMKGKLVRKEVNEKSNITGAGFMCYVPLGMGMGIGPQRIKNSFGSL
jgi:hypothetical protein